MKGKLSGSLFIWICCLTLGMGSMGDQVTVKAPAPDRNFVVTVVDQDDVSLDLENFSCAGKTFITGKMGKAELSIDFEKIRSILLVEKRERLTAMVTLEDNQQIELDVEKDVPCFGSASFADVRILAHDIKKVVLHGIKQANE
jgi:hypothetical protein